MTAVHLFDLVLPVALVLLAEVTLRQRRTSEALIQFMVFGLLVSIAWVRVRAPDLALTEAAIGSGVTGALLLAALRRLGPDAAVAAANVAWPLRLGVETGCVLAGAVLTWILIASWPPAAGLTESVYAQVPFSGGSNPVTAVVLNFRSWDTLLEMCVLLAAVLCVYASRGGRERNRPAPAGPVFTFYLGHIAPLFVLMILYMIWVGARAPGGAFPAGALLAGLGVLAALGPRPPALQLDRFLVRCGLVIGAAVFLSVGVAALRHGALLEYPPAWVKELILLIEIGCTLSIGVSLVVLFAGCAGQADLGRGAE